MKKNVQKATLFEMLQVLIFAYLYWGYEPFLLKIIAEIWLFLAKNSS